MSTKKEPVKAAKPAVEKADERKKPSQRAKTSYIHFCADHREGVIKENPNAAFTEIGKILGQMWRDADPKTKDHYKAKFEAEKERIAKGHKK